MDEKLKKFFEKNNIKAKDIMYILRDGRQTAFHLVDGRVCKNYAHIKDLEAELSAYSFIRINKSIIVAKHHIVSVEDGIYTMADGRDLKGRVRTPGAHKITAKSLGESRTVPKKSENPVRRLGLDSFAVLEAMNLPFCLVELVFDKNGRGMDFIFRYCNAKMAEYEGKPLKSIVNRSFFEIFDPDVKRNWLTVFADVTINGESRVIHDLNEQNGRRVSVYCFRPKEGFCACVLTE